MPAPAASPAPAPDLFLAPLPDPGQDFERSEQDSIFGPPAQSDDLFGGPAVPRLDLATALFPPAPPAQPPALPNLNPDPTAALPATAPPPDNLGSTLAYMPQAEAVPPQGDDATALLQPIPESQQLPLLSPTEIVPAPPGVLPESGGVSASDGLSTLGAAETKTPTARQIRQSRGAERLLIPLMAFSVLATILIGLLLWKNYQLKSRLEKLNLLETLPDVDGDRPGVEQFREKTRKQGFNFLYKEDLTTQPIPAGQRVRLKDQQPLTVGALEVTPLKVEFRKVKIKFGNAMGEKTPFKSIVLHLKLKNVSTDQAFAPLDNYFDRCWISHSEVPPFTMVEIGSNKFYGGPCQWIPRKWVPRNLQNERRQSIDGRHEFTDTDLQPNESVETFVCTDGGWGSEARGCGDRIESALANFKGPILYRVHVRRGFVPWRGKDMSASTVIGVEFTGQDIINVDDED
jgi:hypothetical protein